MSMASDTLSGGVPCLLLLLLVVVVVVVVVLGLSCAGLVLQLHCAETPSKIVHGA